MPTALSYVHGASSVPLLGETIGENLRRTVEQFGSSEALSYATRTTAPRTPSCGSKRRVPPAAYSPEALRKVIGSASGRPTVPNG